MKIKIAVTDGVAALYREQFGEKWQNAIEKTITELNRRFTAQKGSNVRDYPADDFPFGEWEIDGVMVLFRVQGRGVPPQFILRGEWERVASPPQNRSNPFELWHETFMEFDIPDAGDERCKP